MTDKIIVDKERRLYVIPCNWRRSRGYTCRGFDNAFELGTAIATWLLERGVSVELPKPENVGTLRGYSEYEATVTASRKYFEKTKERCPVELCPQLIGLEGKRVEVVDVYGEERRFYVGKSTGWIPCHLEIARIDSTGGIAVTSTSFRSVRIVQTRNRIRRY